MVGLPSACEDAMDKLPLFRVGCSNASESTVGLHWHHQDSKHVQCLYGFIKCLEWLY